MPPRRKPQQPIQEVLEDMQQEIALLQLRLAKLEQRRTMRHGDSRNLIPSHIRLPNFATRTAQTCDSDTLNLRFANFASPVSPACPARVMPRVSPPSSTKDELLPPAHPAFALPRLRVRPKWPHPFLHEAMPDRAPEHSTQPIHDVPNYCPKQEFCSSTPEQFLAVGHTIPSAKRSSNPCSWLKVSNKKSYRSQIKQIAQGQTGTEQPEAVDRQQEDFNIFYQEFSSDEDGRRRVSAQVKQRFRDDGEIKIGLHNFDQLPSSYEEVFQGPSHKPSSIDPIKSIFHEVKGPLSEPSSLPIYGEPVYDVYEDDKFDGVLGFDILVNNDDKSKSNVQSKLFTHNVPSKTTITLAIFDKKIASEDFFNWLDLEAPRYFSGMLKELQMDSNKFTITNIPSTCDKLEPLKIGRQIDTGWTHPTLFSQPNPPP